MSKLKAYNQASQKYGVSHDDNLQTKLALFTERCNQASLSQDERHLAFSAMLTGAALKFFLTHVKGNKETVHEMVSKIQTRFITQDSVLALTREWETLNLTEYHGKQPEQPLSAFLNGMVARLQELQLCLPRAFHSDELLKSRLLNACSGVEACRLARQKVAPTVMGVIADLETPISTFQTTPPFSSTAPTALVIDRRLRQNTGAPPWRGRRNYKQARKCLVCKKSRFWFTNHSAEERARALGQNLRL